MQFMAAFISQPWLAALIGIALLGAARLRRRPLLTLAAGLWLLYAAYETGMKLRWLCSGECNIRIDLLLIYPLLLVATAVGLLSLAFSLRRPRP